VNSFLSITQVVMIIYGAHFSNRFKVQMGFLMAAGLILSLPFAAHMNENAGAAFWSCFFILLVFGVVNGMIQGQVFGLASILPEKYMGAVMLGNGYSGITMNVLKAILMILLPGAENMYKSALIFFIIATFILLLCAYSFEVLIKTEFFNHYLRLSEMSAITQILAEDSADGDEEIHQEILKTRKREGHSPGAVVCVHGYFHNLPRYFLRVQLRPLVHDQGPSGPRKLVRDHHNPPVQHLRHLRQIPRGQGAPLRARCHHVELPPYHLRGQYDRDRLQPQLALK
jgi:hypothetical protein